MVRRTILDDRKNKELTKANTVWNWQDEHTVEFEKAKEHLMENIKLHRYDRMLPINIYCDTVKTAGLG